MASLLQRAARTGLAIARFLSPLAPLLTRLVIGVGFVLTGRGKLEHFDRTVSFFTDLQIPFPAANAAFVSRLEFYGGMFLVAGLLTRLIALGLASSMVVALLTADRAEFVKALLLRGDAGLTDVASFVFLLFLLWLVLFGPGPLSLDRWLFSRLGSEEERKAG